MRRRYKRALRALRRPFEWMGVFLGYLVLSTLPRRAMLAVCDFAAGVMYFFDRRGRALALSNLRVIYGRDIPGADKSFAAPTVAWRGPSGTRSGHVAMQIGRASCRERV